MSTARLWPAMLTRFNSPSCASLSGAKASLKQATHRLAVSRRGPACWKRSSFNLKERRTEVENERGKNLEEQMVGRLLLLVILLNLASFFWSTLDGLLLLVFNAPGNRASPSRGRAHCQLFIPPGSVTTRINPCIATIAIVALSHSTTFQRKDQSC